MNEINDQLWSDDHEVSAMNMLRTAGTFKTTKTTILPVKDLTKKGFKLINFGNPETPL